MRKQANADIIDANSRFFTELRDRFAHAAPREDEATRELERRCVLIAAFIEDQLSVRPPISSDEVARLKRQLAL